MERIVFTLDRYLNIRSALGPTFSPDGRFVAFLTNVTGVPQLWQVPIDGGWPTQLTFTHEPVRGAWYSPTLPQIIFSMDAGGNEKTQLFLLKGVGGNEHEIGDGWNTEDISKHPKAVHQFGGWSHDGKRIAFSANRVKDNRFDVYVQTLGGEAKLLKEGPGGYYGVVGWSPDDQWLLVSRNESNFNQDLYLIETATGKSRHLTPHEGDVQYEHPQWSASGKSIFCASTHGGRDLTCMAQIDVETGQVFDLGRTTQHEVEALHASKNGRWLARQVNADGKSELLLRDVKFGKDMTPAPLPAGVITEFTISPDETKAAFVFDAAKNNPDVWLWDLTTNKLRQLTHANRAGIPFSTFVEPELIRYKTFDGKMIPAWYYAPKIQNRNGLPPVIVYPHGGPESQTRPNFASLFQYFLSRGYGILAPNVRGSSGHGTAYMNLDNTVKRMDSVKDLAFAVHWLRDNGKADPKRIAVYGGSYGGFMVLAGVTNYPDLFAAGIDVVGIANFVTFLENTGAYRRAHREAEYGNLRDHKDFLIEISPLNHVDKIKCPMMVIHGANDPRVPVIEAEQIVAALLKRKIPVEYLRYEDEGHGLAKLKNRLDAYPKMVDFLDRYLK